MSMTFASGGSYMPASYRPPIRGDSIKVKTHSQSKSSNLTDSRSKVAALLKHKGGGIISIQPDDTLGRATEILRDHSIGALVVTDADGALCGILSERDIVRKLADTPGQTLPKLVEEIMVRDVITCGPDDDLVSVLKKMQAGRFRHMPVVQDGKLTAMVTIGDVVGYRLSEVEHEALQLKQLVVG